MFAADATTEVATFAGGCFWGVEHIFIKHYPPSENKGILKTAVGYTGGMIDSPKYPAVSAGNSGHAEALRIEFDPNIVSYAELVGECATASPMILIIRSVRLIVNCALTFGRGFRILLPNA